MDTPKKFKLMLLNTSSELFSRKFQKEIDCLKLFLSNYDEVSLKFSLLGRTAHYLNLTRNVGKVEIENEGNNDRKIIIKFIFEENVEKSLYIKIDLNSEDKDKKNEIFKFYKTCRDYLYYSLDKNPKKLNSLPKIYRSPMSYTPTDKLSNRRHSFDNRSEQSSLVKLKRNFETLLHRKDEEMDKKYNVGNNNKEKPLRRHSLTPEPKIGRNWDGKIDLSLGSAPKSLDSNSLKKESRLKLKTGQRWSPRPVHALKKRLFNEFPAKPPKSLKLSSSSALRGFFNSTNICYINATMQSIMQIKDLEEKFRKLNELSPFDENSICYEILKCYDKYKKHGENDDLSPLALTDLKDKIEKFNKIFCGNSHQDAHEYLMTLFTAVEEELKKKFELKSNKNRTDAIEIFPFEQFFGFKVEQTLSCPNCGLKRKIEEENLNLSLDFIPLGEMGESGVELRTDSEECNDQNGKNGKNVTKTEKRQRPQRNCKDFGVLEHQSECVFRKECPSHGKLYMQQKMNRSTGKIFFVCSFEFCRFTSDALGGTLKNNKNEKTSGFGKSKSNKVHTIQKMLKSYFKTKSVEFNCESCDHDLVEVSSGMKEPPFYLILHLKRFEVKTERLEGGLRSPGRISKLADPFKIDFNLNLGPFLARKADKSYKLRSVVHHRGNFHASGHYVADVFSEELDSWVSCDDTVCKRVCDESIDNDEKRKTCYLLFYKCEETR